MLVMSPGLKILVPVSLFVFAFLVSRRRPIEAISLFVASVALLNDGAKTLVEMKKGSVMVIRRPPSRFGMRDFKNDSFSGQIFLLLFDASPRLFFSQQQDSGMQCRASMVVLANRSAWNF